LFSKRHIFKVGDIIVRIVVWVLLRLPGAMVARFEAPFDDIITVGYTAGLNL